MSISLLFAAQFTAAKVGKQDLTVTVDIVRITRSDGTQTAAASGAAATQITTPNKRGGYFYLLTGADPTLYDYLATFITSDGTVDQKEIPALGRPAVAVDDNGMANANIRKVNDVTVTGAGTGGNPWGP